MVSEYRWPLAQVSLYLYCVYHKTLLFRAGVYFGGCLHLAIISPNCWDINCQTLLLAIYRLNCQVANNYKVTAKNKCYTVHFLFRWSRTTQAWTLARSVCVKPAGQDPEAIGGPGGKSAAVPTKSWRMKIELFSCCFPLN